MRLELRLRLLIAICSLTLTVCFSACGLQATDLRTGVQGRSDQPILSFISPGLSETEQIIMYDALALLDQNSRRNVIFYEGISLHANSPSLLAQARYIAPTNISGFYFAQDGESITFPEFSNLAGDSLKSDTGGIHSVNGIAAGPQSSDAPSSSKSTVAGLQKNDLQSYPVSDVGSSVHVLTTSQWRFLLSIALTPRFAKHWKTLRIVEHGQQGVPLSVYDSKDFGISGNAGAALIGEPCSDRFDPLRKGFFGILWDLGSCPTQHLNSL